jgi:hypothetical protein
VLKKLFIKLENKNMQVSKKRPLTNVQLELLKTFSHQLPDKDLIELRKTLAHFFAERLIQQADEIWEEKEWNNQVVDTMLHTKMRKSK